MQEAASMTGNGVSSKEDGYFSEAFLPSGRPREHWASLIRHLNALGVAELNSRTENCRSILMDHGVTYNALEERRSVERPWELDLIPFLMTSEEWGRIEEGLSQRIRLLNMVLEDLYAGPQKLLRHGFIPHALAYANPSFLRPCRGLQVPGNQWLHLLAVDLARSPDGRWQVISDRAQATLGIGYALENRSIIARVFPNSFRNHGVRRLNPFFERLRQALKRLKPEFQENPRMVLMTPGAGHEAYFEHALLARYLGMTLVEGEDLTVRERQVHVKTLEGLQKVDVILKRMEDSRCDPLELNLDSVDGTSGLLECIRSGNVTVANALGAGFVESPALASYLPRLSRFLLGEDLKLPVAPSWWCGDAAQLRCVMDRLSEIVVKPAFSPVSKQAYRGAELSANQLSRLRREIRQRPHEYVGQAHIPLSQAPVWTRAGLRTLPIVLRVYVAAGFDSDAVLPGGLARVSNSLSNPVLSLQGGGRSKDIWVIGDRVEHARVLPPVSLEHRPAMRVNTGVPSRVADNLYWLGRYAERLENRLRILRGVLSRMIDEAHSRDSGELDAMLALFPGMDLAAKEILKLRDPSAIESHVVGAFYDEERKGGIVQLLDHLRRNASRVRDRLSSDTWRILNRLQRYPGQRSKQIPGMAAQEQIHHLIMDLSAFSGLIMENMTRGYGWRFMDLGRRLERAAAFCSLLQLGFLPSKHPYSFLNPLLEICDSAMTYRRRYFSQPTIPTALEALLLDPTNPRALVFQMNEMIRHAAKLPQPAGSEAPGGGLSIPRELRDALTGQRRAIVEYDESERNRIAFGRTIEKCAKGFERFSGLLTQNYFNLISTGARF